MKRFLITLAAALAVTAAAAQTQTCPETHYPCGSSSCCPK